MQYPTIIDGQLRGLKRKECEALRGRRRVRRGAKPKEEGVRGLKRKESQCCEPILCCGLLFFFTYAEQHHVK